MNGYLIPANSKKSQLIFGLFKLRDLIILLTGVLVTLVFLFWISDDSSNSKVTALYDEIFRSSGLLHASS